MTEISRWLRYILLIFVTSPFLCVKRSIYRRMSSFDFDKCPWKSRHLYVLVLIAQVLGTSLYLSVPNTALTRGTTGYLIGTVLAFGFIGIPLLYMEYIVGQFTGRSCIDVWKIRPCLSHIGYIQVIWQIFLIVYNHLMTSFVIHYFLISIEIVKPYYMCGPWSTETCNIEKVNYTINEDCIKLQGVNPHCEYLYTTYPEYQYWRNYMLGSDKSGLYVAWRVCLGSAIGCSVVYFCCFKRRASMKWFIYFFTIYPIIGYFVLMIGSMMQKGLVVKFEEAMDTHFEMFAKNYRISEIIYQTLSILHMGSGISFNLASTTCFRTPCYSTVVITSVVCVTFTVLVCSTVTMMTCPYAFDYNSKPSTFMKLKISFMFEKTPRLLKHYEHRSFWLILCFSCNAVLGVSTTAVTLFALLETFSSRYAVIDKYEGLVAFAAMVFVFSICIPFYGKTGVYAIYDFRRFIGFINILLTILEILVFVLLYGLHKFCDDVYFMQGIQPSAFMKLAWSSLSVALGYVLGRELYLAVISPSQGFGDIIGRWTLLLLMLVVLLGIGVQLIVAACKKQFRDSIKIDPTWGPSSEVLLRSRAMFSAHAMTKEYMYRQYHLQAGIQNRQKASNIRQCQTKC